MNKLIYSLLGVVALVALGAVATMSSPSIWADAPRPSETGASAEHAMAKRVFSVDNMTCATCPITVKRAMSNVEGVRDISVDFAAKTATAEFDPTIVTASDIAAASTNAGYPAAPIEGEQPTIATNN